uniref:SAP domain-containing protein n=1 Tax=Calcidiscus leptoporus TaxID=127549 RepID=A0A7S0IIL6_9EUKA|mmetsp:Transcript_10608/g.24587  ORF Transcript_10608/g.24587 Transcript_10608/m.24587 type:complete len:172 (+) Transcript_10608:126-641(+)|eukprot:CAMPEP_0119376832 /NCGR_PEP_ID=MMETSP1334-20130426/41526_1 /TAXON_ID=127549 /ORGANISM="Calcidiscus leptoporus, Strain RCC1130" /LENGTH=171 /DNA_ID=CAMNT_0007395523 /DNA_START=126 /DNA_END=641 /DNA_ORIENTATION=-
MADFSSENSPPASTTSPPPACSSPYFSLNPGVFDSAEHWSYRDLQRLAKRLGVPANGARPCLVARLQSWHREKRNMDQAGKFLGVEVRSSPGGQPISPRLLSPLVGIVKRSPAHGSQSRGGMKRSPLRPRVGAVVFSPFNQVKLIPSKEHTEMFGQYIEPSWDDGMEDMEE